MTILLVGLVGLTLFGCTSTGNDGSAPDDPSAITPAPTISTEPRSAVRLGVAAGRRSGQTPIDAIIGVEQTAGRQLDVLRAYAFWDSEFPDLRHRFALEGDRLLHLSINARRQDGSIVSWQSIATAAPGDEVHAELVDWVERLAEYQGQLRVTFHHEADIEPEFGSPEEFVAAWRHFVTLLGETAPDVETVWVSTAFNLDRPVAEQFWPGDDHVDMIGADAFNWFGCRGNPEAWRSPQEVLAPLMTFAANHPGKPLVLAELGSDEDDDDPFRKAAWLDELARLIATDEYRRLDTVIFFHNDHDADSTCDWWLDSSEASADAFHTLAGLPLFGGDKAAAPPDRCPAVTTVYSSVDDLALVDGDGDGRYDFGFGDENRFVGVGDQSADGADHRVLVQFDTLGDVPPDATIELRLRIGEVQPDLTSPVELRSLDEFDTFGEAFGQEGQVLEAALFDNTSAGGHHVVDLTGRIDPSSPTAFRLQLATPPESDDGQAALYLGMGDANRSIDRPALIVRRCP